MSETESKKRRIPAFVRFLIRLGIFSIICGLIILAGVFLFLFGPSRFRYHDGDYDTSKYGIYCPPYDSTKYNVLFDPHSHTTYSNGKLTVEQNLQYHIAMGFNACVISDSYDDLYGNKSWEASKEAQRIAREKYADKIIVIPGIEYHTARIHLNLLFPPNRTDYEDRIIFYGKKPTDEEIKSVIDVTHSLGGIVIVDHVIWSDKYLTDHPSRQQFKEWKIDAIEVINGAVYDQGSYKTCIDDKLAVMAATGMHIPDVDKVGGWTALHVADFTAENIFAELKARKTELVYVPGGAPYPFVHEPNLVYHALRPLYQLGDLIEDYNPSGNNLDRIAFGIFLGYLGGIFVILEIARKISIKCQKK